ncbi:MAG: hypothetical protein ABIE94_04315 [archaeon]
MFLRKRFGKSKRVPSIDVVAYRTNPFTVATSHLKRFIQHNKKRMRNLAFAIFGTGVLAVGIAAYGQKEADLTPPTQPQYPPTVEVVEAVSSSQEYYTVEQGDSFWLIAAKYGHETDHARVGFIKEVQEINELSEARDVVYYDAASNSLKLGKDGLADLIAVGERFKVSFMEKEESILKVEYSVSETQESDEKEAEEEKTNGALGYAAGAIGAGLGIAGLLAGKNTNGNGKSDLERLVDAKNNHPSRRLDNLAKEAEIQGYSTEEDVREGFARYFRDYNAAEIPGVMVDRYDSRIETKEMRKDRQALYKGTIGGMSTAMKEYLAEQAVADMTVKQALEAYTSVYGMSLSKTTFYKRNKDELGVKSRREIKK